MADYTATSDMTLEAAITAGSMADGENLTVTSGAVVTCDQTPSILMGEVRVTDGKFKIDGENISAGNMINFVGKNDEQLDIREIGEFEVVGDWYSIGTTDGSNSQTFNLATYYDSSFCVDVVPMIQVETGRRIDFDGATGTTPSADDWIYKTSDRSVMGRVVSATSTYIVVRFLTGTLANNDAIECRSIVDNVGPDLQTSWTALVNNASGDILESGVYQEFGNTRSNGTSYIANFHHGIGGFVFDNAFQSTTLTMGTAAGSTGGFVPPSGCDVRVPNVHFSSSDATNYGSNNTYCSGTDEGARHNLNTGYAGSASFSICNVGSAWLGCATAEVFTAEYVGATMEFGCNNCASQATYDHCVIAPDPVSNAVGLYNAFRIVDMAYGAAVTDCMMIHSMNNDTRLGCGESVDVTISGCIATTANAASFRPTCIPFRFANSRRVTLENNTVLCGDNSNVTCLVHFAACHTVTSEMWHLSATQDGADAGTENQALRFIQFCSGHVHTGFEMIESGSGHGMPGDNFFIVYDSADIKFRCLGMLTDKVAFGSDAEYLLGLNGFCDDLSIARCYKTGGATLPIAPGSVTSKGLRILNCSGTYASQVHLRAADDLLCSGIHGASGTPGGATGIEDWIQPGYGRNIHDGFRSDTVGWIVAVMVKPLSAGVDQTTITAGAPWFNKGGDLNMVNGDVIEFEQDHWSYGHTGFSGTYSAVTGAAAWNANEWTNTTLDFQYALKADGGAWNGSWLDVRTAGNWTGITGDIEEGVKLKFRFTATGTESAMSMLIIDTTTTLADQAANLYPIDQVEVAVTVTAKDSSDASVVEDARVRLVADAGGDLAEGTSILAGLTNASGVVADTAFAYTSDQPVVGWVRKMSVSPKYKQGPISGTITSSGFAVDVPLIPDE